MATPPTFIAEYGDVWNNNTTPKTAAGVSLNTGEKLIILAASETNNAFSTPTGGGLTYNLLDTIHVSSFCEVSVWEAVAAAPTGSFTLSVACTGGQQFGFAALKFSGSDGASVSEQANVNGAAPSLNVTPATDNCCIVTINADWNAGSGARTWRTINGITPTAGNGLETSYIATGNYTIYIARWNDAGAGGVAKTTGLSAPTGQKYSIVSVVVPGSAAAGPSEVALTPARVQLRAVTVQAVPGAVSVALTPARFQLRALVATVEPVPVTVVLTPARLRLRALGLTATPGEVTVALSPGRLRLRAMPLGTGAGPTTVELSPATLRVRAMPLLAEPGPVAVALAPARLRLRAASLSAIPGPVSVALVPARLRLYAVPLTIISLRIVELTPARLRLRALALVVQGEFEPFEPPRPIGVEVSRDPIAVDIADHKRVGESDAPIVVDVAAAPIQLS